MEDALRKAEEERQRRRARGRRPLGDEAESADRTPVAPVEEEPRRVEDQLESTDAPSFDDVKIFDIESLRGDQGDGSADADVPEDRSTGRKDRGREIESLREEEASRPAHSESRGPTLKPPPEEPAAAAPSEGGRRKRSRAEKALDQGRRDRGTARSAIRVDERVVSFHAPRDRRAEQFRGVRTAIQSSQPPVKTILVTSAEEGEGKTVVTANLGASFAETGHGRVLVVDGNLRSPTLDMVLAGRDDVGLADCLVNRGLDPHPLVQPTPIPGVDLLPAGRARENPGSLLTPGALHRGLGPLLERYDVVLIDAPSLEIYTDAQVMAQDVDGCVVVVRLEGTSRTHVLRAIEMLDAVDARVLGTVVTHERA